MTARQKSSVRMPPRHPAMRAIIQEFFFPSDSDYCILMAQSKDEFGVNALDWYIIYSKIFLPAD